MARDQIVVDLETVPMDGAGDYLDPLPKIPVPDLDAIQPAKNLVDPAKIAADIEKRKFAAMDAYEEAVMEREAKWQALLDGCAVDPDLLNIACLGWMAPGDIRPRVMVCRSEAEEREALEAFWRDTMGADYITFNGLTFDLLVLMRRSLYLNTTYQVLNVDRFRTTHIDLFQKLTYNGVLTKRDGHKRSLQFYLARFGIPYMDVSTGKDIAALVQAGDWEGVKAHCEADVLGTLALARRLGLVQSQQPVAEGAF